MPLGSPDDLDTFWFAGFQLRAIAPKRLKEGATAVNKYFFYKDGDTQVQKGRILPEAIEMEFEMNGDEALLGAQFLKRLHLQQKKIDLRWMTLSFMGMLDHYTFTYTTHQVTGSLTYTPMTDLANKDATTQTARNNAFGTTNGTIPDFVLVMKGNVSALTALFNSIKGAIDNLLGPVFDFLAKVDAVLDQVNQGLAFFRSVAAMPGDLVGQIGDSLQQVTQTLTSVYSFVHDTIFVPIVPILQGTADFLVKMNGALALVGLDKLADDLANMSYMMDPPPAFHTVTDLDTIRSIADAVPCTPTDILLLNPGLNAANLTIGQVLKVPHA